MRLVIIVIILLILFSYTFSLNILFNVIESGHLPIGGVWSILIDSLESWGAIVDTVELYGWNPESLFYYDQIWLIGEGRSPFFSEAQKTKLINYVKLGKQLYIFIIAAYFTLPLGAALDDLVRDRRWNTTVRILPISFGLPSNPYAVTILKNNNFLNFFLLENVDSLTFRRINKVKCGNNCYPFVIDFNTNYIGPASTDYIVIRLAICYPFIEFNDCSYIIIQNGFHMWEDVEYHEPQWNHDNFELTKNILLAPSNLDFPCPVPEPYQISVTSIPPCATPGDTVRICGRNLWRGKTESLGGDIEIYIGATEPVPHEYDTIVIPIRYSQNYTGDSTWIEFIMPDLPPGTYPIRLGHKAITFDAGDIIVPCPMVTEIPECANPGDTVIVSGVNLLPDIVIKIDDTIIEPINYALGYDTLEFVCPLLPAGDHYISFFWDTLEIFSGNILIPCPPTIEIPECANPGDTVVVSGVNLFPDIVIQIGDLIIEPISYALGYDTLEFICPSIPSGAHQISFFWDTLEIFSGSILIPCPTASASFPECADPGDVITISGENLAEPISITVGDSVISAVSYSEDRSKVAFRCPWLPRGRYRVSLSWHDMSVASGMIEIPCPHRCERFPNPITPNFDAINDFAQFEFDGIFVKPARIHIFDIHGHEIRTINVPAGLSAKQHARWDGTDDDGNPVPEGVYIYTIEVAGEVVCEGTVTVAR